MTEGLSRHPLYRQVADVLIERIAQGIWKPGSVIPNEVELARQMGVSHGTMRKALDRLENYRVIVRRQGRGTFVEDYSSGTYAQRYELVRDSTGEPLEIAARLISQEMGAASEIERSKLQLMPSDQVLRTTRLRKHAGSPYMYETAVVAAKRFPNLREDAGDYLIAALAQKHGVILGRAVEDLSLCPASNAAASALKLRTDELLVRLDRVINTLAGEPAEWRVAFCPLRKEQYTVVME
jgi:GntR family transcriptional regulator